MGGSSLAPEVFQRMFGNASGYPELIVLDSTHPAAVRSVESELDLPRTLFLVSSKSGTTTETLSFFRYFWQRVSQVTGAPGRHFVAITDPTTPLERLARERGFRAVFRAQRDVGGRYSALTVFGLVPAALIGLDIHRLLDEAWTMSEACAFCVPGAENPGLTLGATLAEGALAGRDKITFLTSASLAAFPTWAEQLIAESTGKNGKGIVPIVEEPAVRPDAYAADRLFVYLHLQEGTDTELREQIDALEAAGFPTLRIQLSDTTDLGQEFFRWEVAVAAAGAALGIHPFDQPDVELAKQLASKAMKPKQRGASPASSGEGEPVAVEHAEQLRQALKTWLAGARPRDYIALQAYLPPNAATTTELQALRASLLDRFRLATTLGYGPRFLHSTGQLHKGGPNTGLFLQIIDVPAEDVPVPETDYTFGELIHAQALGDYQALRQRGRRVLRVSLGSDVARGLQLLQEALRR
jgi:transaldolase/glucose-6-phosphate isomerase